LLSSAQEKTLAKWWHVSWKRVSKALLVIFLTPLLLVGVKILVHRHLEPWRTARSFAATNPDLDRVPGAVSITTVANLSGERIERFGFSVQLPWRDIYRDRILHDVAFISSQRGGLLTISDPSTPLDQVATMRIMANDVPALRNKSNYELTVAAMNAKSEQVKWWKTPGQNARDFNLLLIKELFETDCQDPIYAIHFGDMRGFQQGNPSNAPYCAKLMLFDPADRHYEFTFGEYPESIPIVTQAEINAMVASLRPVSHN
jgi:hypothetical protein